MGVDGVWGGVWGYFWKGIVNAFFYSRDGMNSRALGEVISVCRLTPQSDGVGIRVMWFCGREIIDVWSDMKFHFGAWN
jgi:hypothetical protein